jgi:hypothetical protein
VLDDAIARLRRLRPELPDRLQDHWSALEAEIGALFDRLDEAEDPTAPVTQIVTMLAPYGAVRDALAPIRALIVKESEDRATGTPADAARDPALVERTPHMDVDAPEPLSPGARATVQVYVDREALRPGESGTSLVLPDLPRLQLRVWLMTSEHFRVVGAETATLTVRSGEDRSSTARFEVEYAGDAAGEPGLTAAFAYNGRPVGSVSRQLGATAAPAAGRVCVDAHAREPDLVVRVTRDPGGDRRHFLVTVSSPLLDEYADGVTGPWRFDTDPREIVAQYLEAFTTASAIGGRRAALIGAGKRLFRAAPEVFVDAFWALVDCEQPFRSIFIVTADESIPWELMIPVRGEHQRPPLGVEFAVGRWIDEQGVSPLLQTVPLVDSTVIAPTYRSGRVLEFAEREARDVIAAFHGRRITPAYATSIDSALAQEPTSLLHFVGHGVTRGGRQVLQLDPDEELDDLDLEGRDGVAAALRSKHPMVFLNACDVGAGAPALIGADGFPATFARLGAACVIAPGWSVDDAAAEVVAREFYRAIVADPRRPFAEVVAELRARSYEGENPPDSFAAYCFFGDPLAAQAR